MLTNCFFVFPFYTMFLFFLLLDPSIRLNIFDCCLFPNILLLIHFLENTPTILPTFLPVFMAESSSFDPGGILPKAVVFKKETPSALF